MRANSCASNTVLASARFLRELKHFSIATRICGQQSPAYTCEGSFILAADRRLLLALINCQPPIGFVQRSENLAPDADLIPPS